jgi:hypothetical protein
MSRCFERIVEKTKKDTVVGERLFKDTEKFFKNTQMLKKSLNAHSSSLKKIT